MTPVERVLALRRCGVLAAADGDALAALAARSAVRTVRTGDVLVARGAGPDTLLLVLDGLVVLTPDGRMRGPGELVGEVAVCAREPHATTATVRDPGTMLEIPAPAVEELLARSPAVGRGLLRHLAPDARAAENGVAATDDAMAAILDRIGEPPT